MAFQNSVLQGRIRRIWTALTGRRVEINTTAAANEVVFYTGDADEDRPGRILVDVAGSRGRLALQSPAFTPSSNVNARATVYMVGGSLAGSTDSQIIVSVTALALAVDSVALQNGDNGRGTIDLPRAHTSGDGFAPAAPAANNCRLFARQNGGGKLELVARFPTGAVQVIATQP